MKFAVIVNATLMLLTSLFEGAFSQAPRSHDDETVRVDTALVTVPVSVTDRDGKYVTGLSREDFRISEDGVEQTIAFFSPVETPFTVALLIDASPSTGFILGGIVDAVNIFMNQTRPDDRFTIVFFDRRVHEIVGLRSMRGMRPITIDFAPTCCGTSLYDAVDFILGKKFQGVSGRKAIILFTDGVDTTSRKSYKDNLRRAEESDVLIYPVQYDTLVRRRSPEGYQNVAKGMRLEDYERANVYLRELARKTGTRVYRGERFEEMAKAFALIAQELRRQYSVGYYPRVPVKSGRRRQVKVNVSIPNLVVRARESYMPMR